MCIMLQHKPTHGNSICVQQYLCTTVLAVYPPIDRRIGCFLVQGLLLSLLGPTSESLRHMKAVKSKVSVKQKIFTV